MPETSDVVNTASVIRLMRSSTNSSMNVDYAQNYSTSFSSLLMWQLMMSQRMNGSFDFFMPSEFASPLVVDDVLKDLE